MTTPFPSSLPLPSRAGEPSPSEPDDDFDDWGDDEFTPDASRSQYRKTDRESVKSVSAARAGLRIQPRDVELLTFVEQQGFALSTHLSRLTGDSESAVQQRMKKLATAFWTTSVAMDAGRLVWLPTSDTCLLTGLDLPITRGGVKDALFRHQYAAAMLSAELQRITPDDATDVLGVLGQGETFPVRSRFPRNEMLFNEPSDALTLGYGETVLTERQLRSGLDAYRAGRSREEMRQAVKRAAADSDAPELNLGAGALFIIYRDLSGTGEHVPDLVAARPRATDGTPRHVAIEVELTPKGSAEYRAIHRAYSRYGDMYERVTWFTHRSDIANLLRSVNTGADAMGDRWQVRKLPSRFVYQAFKAR